MIIRSIIAWFCNLIDTFSTLYFYFLFDGIELNPISAWLLQQPLAFIIVKLVSMTIAVIFMHQRKDWKFCKIANWILFIEYLLVAIYYIILFIIVII